MAEKKLKLYGLFDAALIPKVWFNLESWQLNFIPLYQGEHEAIAEAIPYLIELDKSKNESSVSELLNDKTYRTGLFITTSLSMEELVKRLAFFYHVEDERGIPYLRRFFDIRLFEHFLNTLPLDEMEFLFGSKTNFYHFCLKEENFRMYEKNQNNLVVYSEYSSLFDIQKLRQFLLYSEDGSDDK